LQNIDQISFIFSGTIQHNAVAVCVSMAGTRTAR